MGRLAIFLLAITSLGIGPFVTGTPYVFPSSNGLFVITVDGKRGYMDRTGKTVIEPRFQGANNFSEGLAVVTVSTTGQHNTGYIDKTGAIVIGVQFDTGRDFHEGLAAVGFDTERSRRGCDHCDPNQRWGYVDKSGSMVINPTYHRVGDFSEGLAAVETDNGKWSFIDKTGHRVGNVQYGYASRFSEGLACVMKYKKFGYIDRTGRTVIPPKFSRCGDFSEGLALVRSGGDAVSPSGLAPANSRPPGPPEYIDKTGRVVIKLRADSADDFSEGLAPFEVKGRSGFLNCGYVDRTGKAIIPPHLEGCEKFSEGLALISRSGKWAFIDKSGHVLFTTSYAFAWKFSDGLAQVQLGGIPPQRPQDAKYGYIDKTGIVVWEPTN